MDQLVVPHAAAGARVEADQGLAEEIVSGPVAAVKVAGRRFDRNVHVAQFFVGAERTPGACIARVLPGALFPGVVAELARLRDGAEGPEALAGAHIVTAYVAGHVLLRGRGDARLQSRPYHDDAAHNDRGRRGADLARFDD